MAKYLFILLSLISAIGCASAGNTRLSRESMDSIIIGQTSQRDIVKNFGYPAALIPTEGRPMHIFKNSQELTQFLYKQTLKKYEDIPEGKYEAWIYFYAFGHALPLARRDNIKEMMIVFDEKSFVYKKFYSDETKTNVFGTGYKTMSPNYEELK